ncbi:MAG: hypothetical protein R3B52_00135 [Candidatus Paceibacterota bacterium]
MLYFNGSSISLGVGADSLDFSEFSDTLSLDAATSIALGANAFTFNLDSSGDFIISDNGTVFASFNDDGTITFNGNVTALNQTIGALTVTSTLSIPAGSIDSAEIATDAVGSDEIATDAVGSDEIAAGAVGASELASSGVTSGTYGSSAEALTLTIDEDGRITSLATSSISASVAADSLDFTDLADTLTLDANLAINSAGFGVVWNEDGGDSDFRIEEIQSPTSFCRRLNR